MKPNRRWTVLLILLAASAALVLFSAPPPAGEVVQATTRPPQPVRAAAPSAPESPDMILALKPRGAAVLAADAFALNSWDPPPPPPSRTRASKPVAPPVPFTVLGKKLEDGQWQVFLGLGDRTFVIRGPGEVIDRVYRVESIAPPNLTLTYLPLQERQTLAIGGT